MEDEPAVGRLPETYARALHLRDAGLVRDEIAARLGMEPAAVGPLLELAEAKLAALEGEHR